MKLILKELKSILNAIVDLFFPHGIEEDDFTKGMKERYGKKE